MLKKNVSAGTLAILATMMLCQTGFCQGVDPGALFEQAEGRRTSQAGRGFPSRGGQQPGAGGRPSQRGGGFGQGGPGRGGRGSSMNPEALFSRFDTNKDGKLTKDEIPRQAERLRQMIGAADKDQDGAITKQEFTKYLSAARGRGGRQQPGARPQPGGRGSGGGRTQPGGGSGQGGPRGQGRGGSGMAPSPETILSRFDANKDGKLTKGEIPEQAERLQQMVKAADKNGDGEITKEELSEHLSTARGRGGRQQPGGGFGGRRTQGGLGDPRAMFDANAPKVGERLPALTAYDDDGNEFQLGDLKGGYSVLVFGCLT